ncbi:13382_t:CDS:2, partial [Racocetra fulgida]
MPLFDSFFNHCADLLDGVSVDQIKVICVLVGAYPAALASGLSGQSKLPKLSLVHIYRQLLAVSNTEYDATGPEMVIVIKLTSLAYSIYDGQNLNLKEVEQESDDQVPESGPSLHPRQKSFTNRIIDSSIDIAQFTPRQLKKAVPANKFPSLLEYFGFIFYFPSIMVGPAIEFEDYRQWANSSGEFENMPDDLVVNIDVFAYETSDNPRALIQSWNCQTDKWLKNYVYLRISPPGQRPTFYTTFTTFAICAIWH